MQRQQRLAELLAQDLGDLLGGTAREVIGGVKADDAARPQAPGAPRSLVGRGPAHSLHLQPRQPRPWRMAGHARQAAVDDGGDALDGHRALGDVGGKDDLALAGGLDGAVLLLGREVAVQGKHQQAGAGGDAFAGSRGAADLGCARQEDQHVPIQPVANQRLQGSCHLLLQRRRRSRGVSDRNGELAAFGAQHRAAAQKRRHRPGVHRGRHHHQPQVGPRGLLEPPQQRQREIALQVALVKLVEHHRGHPVEPGVRKQAARQHALGHEPQPRSRPGHLLKTHLVAGGLAGALAHLPGHTPRRQARRQPAWFQRHHIPWPRQQRRRDAGGLPCPRRRDQHEAWPFTQPRDDVGNQRIDRQRAARLG